MSNRVKQWRQFAKKPRRIGAYNCCIPQCQTSVEVVILRKGVNVHQDKWREAVIRAIDPVNQSFNPEKAGICSRHFEKRMHCIGMLWFVYFVMIVRLCELCPYLSTPLLFPLPPPPLPPPPPPLSRILDSMYRVGKIDAST